MANSATIDVSRRAFLLRGESQAFRLVIGTQCLASRGISCECCRDACESGALRFAPYRGSVWRPVPDQGLCTGCGECAAVCPEGVISVHERESGNG